MKEKNLIIGFTAIVIVIIAGVAIAAALFNGGDSSSQTNVTVDGVTTTNYWDDIPIFEGDGEAPEVITDENGNVIGEKATDTVGEVVTDENGNEILNIDLGGDNDDNGEVTVVDENNAADNGDSADNSDVLEPIEEGFEIPTDENGETISERYPGEYDGWSPIVSPEELGN